MYSTSSGEDTEKLRKRLERLSDLEGDFHGSDVVEILSERCVMIRIVPVPGWDALVVIFQHPAKSLHVALCYPVDELEIDITSATYCLIKSVSVTGMPNLAW